MKPASYIEISKLRSIDEQILGSINNNLALIADSLQELTNLLDEQKGGFEGIVDAIKKSAK